MRLRTRVLLLYGCIIILVLTCIGLIMPAYMEEKILENIKINSENQLMNIDFILTNFFIDVEYDISELLLHEQIINPDDSGFTSFLNASKDTFQYNIGERETAIIADLNAFRLTHPYINSVYIGRESGSFVRSHPREEPTQYDPRERPWYILAKENPSNFVRTEPSQSVISPDVKIGIVKAITYPNGTVYGVLGADITLKNLTEYITSIDIGSGEEILLINQTGIIIASKNQQELFTDIRTITGEQTDYLLNNQDGIITLTSSYLIFHTSEDSRWKILINIPFNVIENEIQGSIITVLIFIILALLLMGVLSIFVFDKTIIHPLINLTEIVKNITITGDLEQKIEVTETGEIGELTQAFISMIVKIKEEGNLKKQAYEDLTLYRDQLEDIIKERTFELEKANVELLKEKEHAETADQLKSAFLATMSHELRTPLNSIIGFTGIMLQGLTGPFNPEQVKQLGMVQNSAKHLLALINDVLDISKIEAGELHIAHEPVDIKHSIQSVAMIMKKTAEEKGLTLIIDSHPDTGEVCGDQRRIEQVLLNLISNAIKFTECGTVIIKSMNFEKYVRISVIDTGMGINPKDKINLFKPFHQIDSGTTRKHEGTGLGLSISKKLVELHGGTITVNSIPGKGTEFIIQIPKFEET